MKPGTHLPFAFERAISRGAQIGCTSIITMMLASAAVVAVLQHETAFYVFALAFGLAAVFVLIKTIRAMLALRTPMTVVETDSEVFKRGAQIKLYLQQRGPASFESLKANLTGEETWRKRKQKRTWDLGTYDLFDSGPFEVSAEQPFERTVTVRVPDLPHPRASTHTVTWKLQVIGKVRRAVDFQHDFPVTVS